MKVLLVNGSPRRQGNTHQALEIVAGALENRGVEAEICQLGGRDVRGCQAAAAARGFKTAAASCRTR